MTHVVVREYARLTTAEGCCSLQEHSISDTAFDHLCELASTFQKGSGAQFVSLEGHRTLRLDKFVGVIETPCGTTLEILPKSASDANDAEESRRLLRKMLLAVRGTRSRDAGLASIESLRQPLTEWVMAEFVRELRALVRRGVRSEYRQVEEQARFLRGRLRVGAQLREPTSRQHLFHVAYDELMPDRAENRLLRSALAKVMDATRNADTWRVARELAVTLAGIPPSQDHAADFARWSYGRLMTHYVEVKPWCEMVLGVEMPLALRGGLWGDSLLFPMDKLFERYVQVCLDAKMHSAYVLRSQASKHSLVLHQPISPAEERSYFSLSPDFTVETEKGGVTTCVLDAKWKRVDQALTKPGRFESLYGLSQGDLYQMHAYGHSYLNGHGDMIMISPKWTAFTDALPPLRFSSDLRLWVVPFDLASDRLLLPVDLANLPWLRKS